MNNTKWREIFKVFYALECCDNRSMIVEWKTCSTDGDEYGWDATWSHFGCEPAEYNKIEWLKIKLTDNNRTFVIDTLKKIHVPGEIINDTVIIYGYRTDIDYLQLNS